MAEPSHQRDPLLDSLDRHHRRRADGANGAARSLFRNLGMVGGLGWAIVLPTLAGLALGRWLDHLAGGGVLYTGALLGLGICAGFCLVWKRMHLP